MILNINLEDSVHGVDHSVRGEDVKEDNISLAGGGLDLDELVPGHIDLLAAGGLEGGGAGGDVLTLEGGAGHNVPQEDSLEGILVGEKGIESISGDLIESSVGGGEHGEGSLGRQNIHKVSGLDSGEEGGELGVGGHQAGDGGHLGGLGDHGDHGDGVGDTEVTMDWAVYTVMRGHVMCDGDLMVRDGDLVMCDGGMVDGVLNRVVDLGYGTHMDHTADLLMVADVHCVMEGGAVHCVMSAMMGAVMMTAGAVSCDGGDKEGGCDKDPHGGVIWLSV